MLMPPRPFSSRYGRPCSTADLTPDEGAAVAAIFETKRRAIETVDLETRLTALEQERHDTRRERVLSVLTTSLWFGSGFAIG